MVTPPDRSTCTEREMRHSPNMTATALSIPRQTTAPTIMRTILRTPLEGAVTAGAGATGTCPAAGLPTDVAGVAAKPVGAPQPWQNLVSGDSSDPHFEQKLAMGIPPLVGVIYHTKYRKRRNSPRISERNDKTILDLKFRSRCYEECLATHKTCNSFQRQSSNHRRDLQVEAARFLRRHKSCQTQGRCPISFKI